MFKNKKSNNSDNETRYSVYSPLSKCVYIKADFPIYLEREIMRYLSDPYFDGWMYEIDIMVGHEKRHLSLYNRKDIKRVGFMSYKYFK